MAQITITIDVPDTATVAVEAPEPQAPEGGSSTLEDRVHDYWEFITDNGRKLFGAMAKLEVESGEFTFDEVAEHLGEPLEAIQAYNRNAGRGASVWKRDTGSDAPIYAIAQGLQPGRRRARMFRLPDGVAEIVVRLD